MSDVELVDRMSEEAIRQGFHRLAGAPPWRDAARRPLDLSRRATATDTRRSV